ncbi:MAG: DUF1667 domain-containing protein [Firmicutes bacterium]|nr:DUF1667 domain-containing protein [Bacillota bacterium]
MKIPEELTCIECPLSCTLRLKETDGKIEVSGNQCRRGEEYGRKEALHPCRSLTTTVATGYAHCPRLPVRTAGEIPRELLFAALREIKKLVVREPVLTGQVLIKNLLGTGVDVIATGELNEQDI